MAKLVDRAIDKAGPLFIAIAVILIDMSTLAFYLVVFPYSHHWTDAGFFGKLYIIATFVFTVYMVYCIHFHYYMAIKTHPGSMASLYAARAHNNPEPSSSTSSSSSSPDVNIKTNLCVS